MVYNGIMDKFNSKEMLSKMLVDKNRVMQILALFAISKKYEFETNEQLQFFIKRSSKAAKRLTCFTNEKIKQTLKYVLDTQDYKVGLETVEKFILEPPKNIDNKKSIITLSNGEDVYDVKRLSELEKLGKIKYNDRTKKWSELD